MLLGALSMSCGMAVPAYAGQDDPAVPSQQPLPVEILGTQQIGVPLPVTGQESIQEPVAESTQEQQAPDVAVTMSQDLSQRTDSELTALTAQWAKLSPMERRRLLAEVRGRMAKNNRQELTRPVGITVRRKYGRVVRKPDGSVVLQTRVVEIPGVVNVQPRPRVLDSGKRQVITFGFGFERRSKSASKTPPSSVQETPGSIDLPTPSTATVSQQPPSSAP